MILLGVENKNRSSDFSEMFESREVRLDFVFGGQQGHEEGTLDHCAIQHPTNYILDYFSPNIDRTARFYFDEMHCKIDILWCQ